MSCKKCQEELKLKQRELEHLKAQKANNDNLLKLNTQLNAKLTYSNDQMILFKNKTDEKVRSIIRQYDNSFENVVAYLVKNNVNNVIEKDSRHYNSIKKLMPLKL